MPGMTRREFVELLSKMGIGACALGATESLMPVLESQALAGEKKKTPMVEVEFYKKLPGKKIQCFVCPYDCLLEDGETCRCYTRTNHGGTLYNHAYNNPCIISVDPVEKMPLNHFLPGSKSLSVATGGCMLRCIYCQNWQQSQQRPEKLKTFDFPKEKVAESAKEKELTTIAYTYTEPIAFLEYVKEVALHTRKHHLRNVAATSLFMKPDVVKDTAEFIDAFAVALKGFDQTFYDKVVGALFEPTLEAIKALKATGRWFELVNLIVPTMNDDSQKIRDMCKWIVDSLGVDVPLHFGRFVPEYKLRDLPRTPIETLEEARNMAIEEGMHFVYIFNVAPHEGNHTYCPGCKTVLMKRLGFKILENNLTDGKCKSCGQKIPGVWT